MCFAPEAQGNQVLIKKGGYVAGRLYLIDPNRSSQRRDNEGLAALSAYVLLLRRRR